jgi:ERCC4-type nuclease
MTGDYSIEGFEQVLTVERKSLPDLVKTVVTDWQRFSRQLRRMSAMDVAIIVCEAPVTALMDKQYVSDINPLSVRGKLNAIQLDFGVSTIFLDNRQIASQWVENLFTLFLERRAVKK